MLDKLESLKTVILIFGRSLFLVTFSFFRTTSQFCTNCEERCAHKCSFAFWNIESWHYWHFRLLKLSKKWLSVTSSSIQCALDKTRFVFELIWLATVCILFTFEATQKCQHCPPRVFRKKKLTWRAATNVTTLVVDTWIRDKLIKNRQWFRVKESVIDMPCETINTDVCWNIGENTGEVN